MQAAEDPLQQAMGQLGRWHIFVCALLFMSKFSIGWHQIGIIFLAPPATYTCVPLVTETGEVIGKCSSACEKQYDRSVFTESIITEWDLVCDKEEWANLSQTIFMLGILIGNVLFGALADNFGRRLPLAVCILIQLVSSVATSFAKSFWLFCVLRFITAFATGGIMTTTFVLMIEIIGMKYRYVVAVLYQIPFYLGHLSLPLFAYFLRDWRYLQFAISIPSIVLVSYWWLLPESPRWLFAVQRVNDTVTVLHQAAKYNKLPTDHIQADIERYRKDRNEEQAPLTVKVNVFDLLRTPRLRVKTLCIFYNWFVCGLAFYGVAQYVGQLSGDIFINVFISAVMEVFGAIICIYVIHKFGRKLTLLFSNMLTGLSILAIAFIPASYNIAIFVLATFGMIGLSISFPTVYLYSGEIFPTVVPTVGIGIASMLARVGSMVAPFVVWLVTVDHILAPMIFGLVSLVGSAVVTYLPETSDHPLPETLEDGENFR